MSFKNPKTNGRQRMIGLEIFMHIPPKHRHELLQAFEIFSIKQENGPECTGGCINRSIFESMGTANRFLWMEKWTDQESLEVYMKTVRFKALLGAIQVLGKLDAIHKGEFTEINQASA
jgi:quinol monooxygenase YgiN